MTRYVLPGSKKTPGPGIKVNAASLNVFNFSLAFIYITCTCGSIQFNSVNLHSISDIHPLVRVDHGDWQIRVSNI